MPEQPPAPAKREGPVVVSVINLKGGVGKTTVVSLLARHIVDSGMNVLAVDLDPQSNLSQALMDRDDYEEFMESGGTDKPELSIVELVDGIGAGDANYSYDDFAFALRRRNRPVYYNYDKKIIPVLPDSNVSPASWEWNYEILYGYHPVWRGSREESALRLVRSRFDFSDNLIVAAKKSGAQERVLADFIAEHAGNEDLVLIDCAPTDSIFTRMAYHASHYILIPVKTEFFSAIGFPLLKESLAEFNEQRGDSDQVKVCGVVINNTTPGKKPGQAAIAAREEIERMARKNEWKIMESELSFAQAYAKLPQNEAAKHIKKVHRREIRWMTEEFLHRVGLPSLWAARKKAEENERNFRL